MHVVHPQMGIFPVTSVDCINHAPKTKQLVYCHTACFHEHCLIMPYVEGVGEYSIFILTEVTLMLPPPLSKMQ